MQRTLSVAVAGCLTLGTVCPALAAPVPPVQQGRPLVRFLDVDTTFDTNALNGSTTMTTTWANPLDPDSGWLTDCVQVDWPNGRKKAIFARGHGWDGFAPHMLLAWPNFHVRQEFRDLMATSAAATAELAAAEGAAGMADLCVGIAWSLFAAGIGAAVVGSSQKWPMEVLGTTSLGLIAAHIVPGWILPPMFESQTRQQVGKAVRIWNAGK